MKPKKFEDSAVRRTRMKIVLLKRISYLMYLKTTWKTLAVLVWRFYWRRRGRAENDHQSTSSSMMGLTQPQ